MKALFTGQFRGEEKGNNNHFATSPIFGIFLRSPLKFLMYTD